MRLRLALLLAILGAGPAQAGVFDDEEARRRVADLKIQTEARFDQQDRSKLELAAQLQRLSQEIAQLRGQVETQAHELEMAKKRQQDLYLDLDSRLRRLESGPVSEAAAPPPGAPAAAPVASASEEYDAALALFKAAKYKEAGEAFAGFVARHPQAELAANAQYWLGNAWYAQRNCAKAIEAQSLVTSKYPASDKAPDAWLAIATCQQELGNRNGARRTLENLVEKYPAAPAASTARERLKKK